MSVIDSCTLSVAKRHGDHSWEVVEMQAVKAEYGQLLFGFMRAAQREAAMV